ncbi:MAG: DUF1788 domain-containing protein [Eubacteriales bacterium]|nr:DUF1788 domain-containing protein [Eubacteriales bacterium]
MLSLEEIFYIAEKKIQDPLFRKNKGLGNEVGYYIFDYPAEQELFVRERIESIRKKNENSDDEYKIVVFDLYDITINILKDKGYLEKCFEFEKKKGFDRITKSVGNMLKITSSDSLLIQHIKKNTPEKSVIFITGIGKSYPILRSHTLLNNLHQVIDRVPVVMFYPGSYDGQELVLFGKIKDDNYYRAFKMVD